MGKRTWDDAIKRGLYTHTRRNEYVYMYGAKGQRLTDSLITYFITASPGHFSQYSAEELAQIRRNSIGKIGYDCSGFTGWVCTGDEQYSTGHIANCSFTTPNLAAGVAGSLLYTTHGGRGRHIGIDIGYGYCLDMGHESTDDAVRNGYDSVRLRKISDCGWEVSGMSKVIDYTGANNR